MKVRNKMKEIFFVATLLLSSCGDREEKTHRYSDDVPPPSAPAEVIRKIDGDWQVINSPCTRIMSFYNGQYFTDTKRCGNRVQRSTGLFAVINDGMIAMSYTTSICRHLEGAELYASYHVSDNTLVIVDNATATTLQKITRNRPLLSLRDNGASQNESRRRRPDNCPKPTPIKLPPYEPQPERPTCIDVDIRGNGNTTIIGNGNNGNRSSESTRRFDDAINTNTNTNINTNTISPEPTEKRDESPGKQFNNC